MKTIVPISVLPAAILLLLVTTAAADSPDLPFVRIGSKSSIENVILGEMLTLLADQAGGDARHQSALGGTQIVFAALKKGDIDAYIEYTGTLSQEILKGQRVRSDNDIRAAVEKHGLVMSQPLGFNNTYALGMKADVAEIMKIASISDLAKVSKSAEGSKLKFGFSDEFLKRGDGWPAVKVLYQFENQPTGLDHSLAYRGLDAGTFARHRPLFHGSRDCQVQIESARGRPGLLSGIPRGHSLSRGFEEPRPAGAREPAEAGGED